MANTQPTPINPRLQVLGQLGVLLADEDNTAYAQGRLLVDSDVTQAELREWCGILKRKVSTLRKRMAVATEFPPSGGLFNPKRPFGVYELLAAIPSDRIRHRLLSENLDCTVEDMKYAIEKYFEKNETDAKDLGRERKQRRIYSQGMRIRDKIYVHGDLSGRAFEFCDLYIEADDVEIIGQPMVRDGKITIQLRVQDDPPKKP